jgi:predicted esterase
VQQACHATGRGEPARRAARGRLGGLLAALLLLVASGAYLAAQRPAPAAGSPAPAPAARAGPAARDGSPPPVIAAAPAVALDPLPRPEPLVAPGSDLLFDEFFVHVPPAIDGRLEVLVTLHGMEGNGPAFCAPLRGRADRERWLVVAPTYPYGDWTDPAQVAREEERFIPRLHAFLADLPARTGLDLEPRIALYGASRGGQLAHRYALVYPEQVQGVAAVAPGTYTLPLSAVEVEGRRVALPFPFGVADLAERFGRPLDLAALRRVPFWVGVGEADSNPDDVPDQWDPYIGTTRVARAEAFVRRLADLGVAAQLTTFPGLGHTLTDEMHARAMDFIATLPP